ncbi:MAG TPA: NAD(P)H-binding protein [Anaerolineaceae bacterium]|nr:NAD(P)H-binding protein [Anaerolineaceae bacterium]
MQVLIVGGTGLLGYHATNELLTHGHNVSLLALPPLPAAGLFPQGVHILLQDLNAMGDRDLIDLMDGIDAVVFAAGVDDRVTPKAPAYPFFYKHNVETTRRIAGICRQAGVKRFIILGSYFAYFNRLWPHMELTRHHPYIRSRVEQTRAAQEAGTDELAVITLELPYIFGTMPGRIPLWKPLIKYAAARMPLFYPHGGTTCVTVRQVAQAIVGAVEKGEPGACYPIGGENLTWVQLLSRITRLAGREKRVIPLPDWLLRAGAGILKGVHRLQGRESGLDPVQFISLQTANTFIDPATSQAVLGYEPGGLDAALLETINVCLK